MHARDSTCVLIESGSNDNHFHDNDCTHGGDGIFIRVLNGWVSTGNVFEGNDCSYANNNGFEAWSPRNVYRYNTANHCSYGFWLGASDQTVLVGNEASYNGDPQGMPQLAPLARREPRGDRFHVRAIESHDCAEQYLRGQPRCRDCAFGRHGLARARNGMPFTGSSSANTLARNRWGLFLQHAEWIDLAANTFQGNGEADINANVVTELTIHGPILRFRWAPGPCSKGRQMLRPASRYRSTPAVAPIHRGVPCNSAGTSETGKLATGSRIEHIYRAPGFYRLGLTVTNGHFSDLAWRDLYVVERANEIGTEGAEAVVRWGWIDPDSRVVFTSDRQTRIVGHSSLHALISPYGGQRVSLRFPAANDLNLLLRGKTAISFWIKSINENVPAWQNANPVVTLYESPSRFLRLEPRQDLLSSPPYNEARDGWTYFSVPFQGDTIWKREGMDITTVNSLTLGFDSWAHLPCRSGSTA